MKKLIIILLILSMPAICSAEWSQQDKDWFRNFTIINAIDFGLTYKILDDGGCELNPVMGDMDTDNIIYYFIGSEMLILGVTHILDDDVRCNWFLKPLSFIKVFSAGHNATVIFNIDY
jgi:hypothetical protein